LAHFPKGLFTLSLQTVSNILDGALQQQNDSATGKTEGMASSDTLLHYLRSLQLDKAAERLRLLADEAGVNIDTGNQQAFTEITGHIVPAYRSCKEKYVKVTDYLAELQSRCTEAARLLEPLPADYAEPTHPHDVAALQQQLMLINDAFDDLGENAKLERERFSEQARKGQFSAILDVPERLLKPIQAQLNPVGGALLKVENAIQTYRENKLSAVNERFCEPLAPLFLACKESAPQAVRLEQIKPLSLHDTQMFLDAHVQKWETQANQLLTGTGMDVGAWRELAAVIASGGQPSIDAEVQERLVNKGILRIQLSFGGGA